MLKILLKNKIYLKKEEINENLKNFLYKNLYFINKEYLIRKKLGKSVYKVDKYFKAIQESENKIAVARGFAGKLIHYLREHKLKYQIIDERLSLPLISFPKDINLYNQQEEVVNSTDKKDCGVIVAPPGSGKTVMGLEIIARKKQPALILVHRKQLLEQWVERIQNFLSIPKKDIGQVSGSKKKVGEKITVGMLQSVGKIKTELKSKFSTIIVDECHHIPAKTFRKVITHFNPYYLYGLTATPVRKYNDEKLIFSYIGDIIAQVEESNLQEKEDAGSQVIIRETDLVIPFDYRIDEMKNLSKILIYDSSRNLMITKDVREQIRAGKKILVLTERKEHIEVLNLYLKDKGEIITLSGDDAPNVRISKMEIIAKGDFQVLISTGQFFGEGMDIPHLDCLFLVYPFSFEGKLVQYMGRIKRSLKEKIIFDYRDKKVEYLEKLFHKRQKYYQKSKQL